MSDRAARYLPDLDSVEIDAKSAALESKKVLVPVSAAEVH